MNFFAEEIFCIGDGDKGMNYESYLDSNLDVKELVVLPSQMTDTQEDLYEDEPVNCLEFIHSRLAPSRHLNDLFFHEDALVIQISI